MSRFLQRTIATLHDKKTKDKEDQLVASLHHSLSDERKALVKLTKISDLVRKDSKIAERIRRTLKQWKEHMTDIETKLHDLGIKFKEFSVNWSKRNEKDTKQRPKSLIAFEDPHLNNLKGRASFISFNSIKESLMLELAQAENGFPDRLNSPTEDLTEHLLDVLAEIHEVFGDRCLSLENQAEKSLVSRWNDYVKGEVRSARYNGHEFFKLYAEFQQHVETYSNVKNSVGENDLLKAAEVKKLSASKKNAKTSREEVFRASGECDKSFEKCELEYNCGHIPFGLLIYLKSFKKNIQELNARINDIFPDETIHLIEKTLNKRYEQKKQFQNSRYERKTEEKAESEESSDGFQESSVHGVRFSSILDWSRSSTFLNEPIISPPSPPNSRPTSLDVQTHHEGLDIPKLDQPPLFAPPPPPSILNKSLPPSPLSISNTAETESSEVNFPNIGETKIDLLKKLMDPSLELWLNLCKNPSSPISPDEKLPVIFPVTKGDELSLYDAIKTAIRIFSDGGLLSVWLERLLKIYGEEVIIKECDLMLSSEIITWNSKVWPTVSSNFSRCLLAFIFLLHIFWHVSKHFVDKSIKEIVHGIQSLKDPKNEDTVKRKTFRVILGQKTFLSSQARQCFVELCDLLHDKMPNENKEIFSRNILSLIVFENLVFPAWSHFESAKYKVDGIDSTAVDLISFSHWTNEYRSQVRNAIKGKNIDLEYSGLLFEFLDNVSQKKQSFLKADVDLWMLKELVNTFELSYVL